MGTVGLQAVNRRAQEIRSIEGTNEKSAEFVGEIIKALVVFYLAGLLLGLLFI